jgi:hypothetical protein
MRILVRSIILGFVWLPLASAQTGLLSASQPAAVTTNDQEGLIDKVMGIAGPAGRSQLTENKRFHLYLLSVAGPVQLLAETAGAGFGQLATSPKAWAELGFLWRAAESNLAYNGLRQTITTGPRSCFTKTTDISLRTNTVSGDGRAMPFCPP